MPAALAASASWAISDSGRGGPLHRRGDLRRRDLRRRAAVRVGDPGLDDQVRQPVLEGGDRLVREVSERAGDLRAIGAAVHLAEADHARVGGDDRGERGAEVRVAGVGVASTATTAAVSGRASRASLGASRAVTAGTSLWLHAHATARSSTRSLTLRRYRDMFRGMGPSASELLTIPLFQGFAEDELSEVADLFKHVDADRKPLFDVNEPATTLYLLTKGEVVLERPGDDTFKLSPTALIGELGALTGLPRSTRATMSPGSTVWALPAKKIQGVPRRAPGAGRAVPREPARHRGRQGPPRSAPDRRHAQQPDRDAEGAQAAARARARDGRDAAVGARARHARQADHAQPPRELPRRAAARARRDGPVRLRRPRRSPTSRARTSRSTSRTIRRRRARGCRASRTSRAPRSRSPGASTA